MKNLAVSLLLMGLVGCSEDARSESEDARIEVEVADVDTVASVEVVDRAVWYGEVGNDEGYSDLMEDAELPAVFEVPAGSYVVLAGQGTCSGSEEITVEAREQVVVSLSLTCVE